MIQIDTSQILVLIIVLNITAGYITSAFATVSESAFFVRTSKSLVTRSQVVPTSDVVVLQMGMKINIRIVGRKSSEPWLEDGVDMYETRLKPSNINIETTWHRDNLGLMKGYGMDVSKRHTVICLDPTGTQETSESFTTNIYRWLDEGGSRLSFIIGGAEGLPKELKNHDSNNKNKKRNANNKNDNPIMISLSALTFTHQFARLLLIEQIYRATEIRKGSGYHK